MGKTTFLEQISHQYVSLDDSDTLKEAMDSPKKFINNLNGKLSAIDECQLVPELFPALKLFV